MKLTVLLVFLGVMQIHAAVYSQGSFNLKETNTTVKEMLRKIEKKSDYSVFYRHDQINLNQKITVFAENASIEEVMEQVLQNQPLTFSLVDKMIVIKSVNDNNALQDYTITGTVTDETGETLPGASVKLKGSSIAVITDINGTFSLKVPGDANATLEVSYLGFTTQEVSVSPNQTNISIRLSPDAAALDEVVVIGYGTVKKRDLTGSVSSVKAEDIVQSPTHNAIEAIQGRVSGVDITRASGEAGGGTNITIRGNKSIAPRDQMAERNQPLYIIDGFQGGDISTLNTNDIESIEVLKDASSTAIYGAQGANGVIIVTTKKGAAGKTRISYNSYYGINKYSFPESRIGEDYLRLRREAYRTDVGNYPATDADLFVNQPGEYNAVQAGQWVDWVDLVVQDGSQQSHTISLNGGSEKTKVFGSAGYFREEGMLRNNTYNRYNGRFNVDQIISKWAKAGILSQVTYINQNSRFNPLGNATSISPLGVPYDEFGQIRINPLNFDPSVISPLADERTEYVARDNNIRTNITANAYIELTPLKGLTFRSNFGSNLNFNRRGIYNDETSLAQANRGTSVASSTTAFYRFLNWDNILTYNKEIGDHSVTLTGITSYLQSDVDNLTASGNDQLLASQLYYGLAGTSTITTRNIASPFVGWKNMAYAARLNYSYAGKYLFTATGRYDGASRLAEGNKWDFFPSVGLGWNVSSESFMQNIKQISNLKLRATYGVSGNYVIDPYGTQSGLYYSSRMSFGEEAAPMYLFNPTVGNPNLGWEKSATTNIGLDLGLFNRVNATLDVYQTKTTDILYRRNLPQSTGVVDIYQNIASTSNNGIELAITSKNIQGPSFKWSSTLTFSRNREKITGLLDGNNIFATAAERESLLLGYPINSFYTFNKLGIWQESERAEAATYRQNSATGPIFEPGDIKLQDLNGDMIIDATNDRQFIGSTVPDWVGGLQNNFTYKGFDLGLFLFARIGQTLDAEFLGRYNPEGTSNSPAIIDYWTPENPTNDFPRPERGERLTNYMGYQTLNFVDGSFFKIKNLTLGYTLPKSISSRFWVDNLRIYATGSNLLTVSRSHLIKDYDPERGGAEDSPLSRQFVFGINLGL